MVPAFKDLLLPPMRKEEAATNGGDLTRNVHSIRPNICLAPEDAPPPPTRPTPAPPRSARSTPLWNLGKASRWRPTKQKSPRLAPRSNADAALVALEQSESELADLSERMLKGVASEFGRDSVEYEKAGGVRKSKIKRGTKSNVTELKKAA